MWLTRHLAVKVDGCCDSQQRWRRLLPEASRLYIDSSGELLVKPDRQAFLGTAAWGGRVSPAVVD